MLAYPNVYDSVCVLSCIIECMVYAVVCVITAEDIGYSDTDEDDLKIEESSNETTFEESENEGSSVESEDTQPEVKFHPATIEGFSKGLRKLWKEFMGEGKQEHQDKQYISSISLKKKKKKKKWMSKLKMNLQK